MADLEQGAAGLIPVADAHGMVGQSLDREILAELSMDEVGSLELLLPMAIGFDLVGEDGALLASVPGPVALPVSVEVNRPTRHRPGTGSFQSPVCMVRPATRCRAEVQRSPIVVEPCDLSDLNQTRTHQRLSREPGPVGICTGESYKKIVKLTSSKGASLKDPARLFNSSLDGNWRAFSGVRPVR